MRDRGMSSTDTSTQQNDAPFSVSRRWSFRRLIVPVMVGLALISSFATFLVMAELTPIKQTIDPTEDLTFWSRWSIDDITFWSLTISAGLILILYGIVTYDVVKVLQARRRGRAASRLHIRVVALFAAIAALPAILVAVIAYVTLDRGLDRAFSEVTNKAIQNSYQVAEAYAHEHARQINGDILAMAGNVARARLLYDQDRQTFRLFLRQEAVSRNLSVAMLLDPSANVIETASTGIYESVTGPSADFLEGATETKPQLIVILENHYVAAVVKLNAFDNTFLYVVRTLEPIVVAQLNETKAQVAAYDEAKARRSQTQYRYAAMFAVMSLCLLASAVLIGLNFSNRLVAPVRRLMGAAQMVATGDLQVQVPIIRSEGDLAQMGEIFNKMTRELRTQRDDLMQASELIDSRRRFTEAVLSAASAGIIGVDGEGRIGILNRSAEKLIGHPEAEALGHTLSEIVPELDELMATARQGYQRLVQGQATISRDGKDRNLSVRVSAEQTGQAKDSYIITLDDITELVSAQRTSAWADVARRIAHEIKNPLTPIQLSAERLRRKYGKVIVEDRAIFEQCTDTIVRQVDDIRRMVDEFSRFARMPKPAIDNEDVADTVRQVVFLMRVGHPDIDIEVEIAEDPMPARFDRRLISQGLTNIIKNATEAIGALPADVLDKGRIEVKAARDGDDIVIDIVDNGIGLPKESRARLLEPYVTTREKGTGLGLAIVGRVLEDHGGRIELNDASSIKPGSRGAWMRLRFAASGEAPKPTASTEPVMEASGT
jgi:two-component system nitrogen regulation sensor histidine kinase NtrY